jgi:hypothetical protein
VERLPIALPVKVGRETVPLRSRYPGAPVVLTSPLSPSVPRSVFPVKLASSEKPEGQSGLTIKRTEPEGVPAPAAAQYTMNT